MKNRTFRFKCEGEDCPASAVVVGAHYQLPGGWRRVLRAGSHLGQYMRNAVLCPECARKAKGLARAAARAAL